MMGHEDPPQPSMFYTSFNLDKRIRPNHPLRKRHPCGVRSCPLTF